ncbi:hypothetical protein WL88_23465 [Burkholderia diffusa]|uniref:Uncharacterized protein n=1 Tax=Burkholderia diffusa TaxID=488732 RepID=A0AAW3PAY8_9BURK|nr:hypothetical protein WL85_23935 [Burkholderia diffusa]KWF47516.1 hypothetical protein WL88_23465 [Burkholderia diffusa]KWF48387.1 hypothetical protein WL87_19705 [Burkholderia diffusa]
MLSNRPAAAPVHGTAPRERRGAPRDPVAGAFGIRVCEFMPGICRRNVTESETTQPSCAARMDLPGDGEGAGQVGAGATRCCAAHAGERDEG